MAFEITKPNASFSIARTQTQAELSRFTRSRDIAKVNREGAKHVAAQHVYELKARLAQELTASLELHEFICADTLVTEMVRRLQEGGRSPEAQAYMEQLAGEILGKHREYAGGIVQIGITNIAQEASKSIEPYEERRWG